jgi:hypothetical protein
MDMLFGAARIADISKGVASLLAGQQPPAPPANTSVWVVYSLLIGLIVTQVGGVIWSARRLVRGRITDGRVAVGRNIILPLILNLVWALITLVVLPKMIFGLPLLIFAAGLPDMGYTLLVSGLIALGWGILRTVFVYSASRARSKTNAPLLANEAAALTNK